MASGKVVLDDDPLGDLIRETITKPFRELLVNGDFIELLQVSTVPGACSDENEARLIEYFKKDQNVAELMTLLFTPPDAKHRFDPCGLMPTYAEYKDIYYVQKIMCMDRVYPAIAHSLFTDAFIPQVGRNVILGQLAKFELFDPIIAEAFVQFLSLALETKVPEQVVASFGNYQLEFMQGICFQAGCASILPLAARMLLEIPDRLQSELQDLPFQLLQQLFPYDLLKFDCDYDCDVASLVFATSNDYKLSLAIATCDLFSRLIDSDKDDTIGSFIISQLRQNEHLATMLVRMCLHDIETLPTKDLNESYGIKVLNSLLQLTQCGCVDTLPNAKDEELRCMNNLTMKCRSDKLDTLWKVFLKHITAVLKGARILKNKGFRIVQNQVIYLLYPLLRVSCFEVDQYLIHDNTLIDLLQLVQKFPRRDILHRGIGRLFIVALEDGPLIFGSNLPVYRHINDPLRLSLLQHSVIDITKKGLKTRCKAMFVDIGISFQQAMSTGPAVSPSVAQEWKTFYDSALMAMQAEWETRDNFNFEQGDKDAVKHNLYDDGEIAILKSKKSPPSDVNGKKKHVAVDSSLDFKKNSRDNTPFSALYNVEEHEMMENLLPRRKLKQEASLDQTFKGSKKEDSAWDEYPPSPKHEAKVGAIPVE